MPGFLEKTAEYLYRKYADKVPGLCIVLPNRRGGLYLKKYLGSLTGRTSWSPSVFSVEDFIARISGLSVVENTRLLFELYDIHRSVEGEKAQAFDEFISWGQQLLGDFNEIDSYLADPVMLFRYLDEARAISLWNLDNKPLTDFEKKYLHFYNSLVHYYEGLSASLLKEKLAYPGLLFRQAALSIEKTAGTLPWEKVIFAGFNALTTAEEKIIDALVNAGKAEVLWDADEYYLADRQQEAGDFLRTWLPKWKQDQPRWIGNDLATGEKDIRVIGVPMHIGQAKLCGKILDDLLKAKAPAGSIAVVLMDEQMLMPVLSSFPDSLRELNITMGLPLDQTPFFGLAVSIFRMQENVGRFTRARSGPKIRFYYHDILDVLRHPYIAWLCGYRLGENAFAFDEMVRDIRNGSRVFLDKEEITGTKQDLFSASLDFLDYLFVPWDKPADALLCLKNLVAALRDSFIDRGKSQEKEKPAGKMQVEVEFLYAFSRIFNQLTTLLDRYGFLAQVATLHNLFTRLASGSKIPFYGEPLKGVQLMGMLETRTLDFENLVLLSVNEDLLPTSKVSASFIPFDIRKEFRLPTHHYKNSVYGYHFYRLLQRAKNVYLLYNSEADELGGGDKSRFIKQIMAELPSVNPGIRIREEILSTPPVKGRPYPAITIKKEGEVLEQLLAKAKTGLAPTTLDKYRLCPLQFYFSSIAGLSDRREMEDTIDPQVLGQAVHEALMKLHKPYIDRVLRDDDLEAMISGTDEATDNAFLKKYKGSDITFGKNLLLVKVAKIMIRKFLESERSLISSLGESGETLTVRFLEEIVNRHITVPMKNGNLEVRIKGFIDRIDSIGGEWRIIDYKTGRFDKKELKIGDWSDFQGTPEQSMSFQLLSYAWLFGGRFGNETPAVRAGIIPLKKSSEGFTEVSVPVAGSGRNESLITRELLAEFVTLVENMVSGIYDTDQPFIQTEDLKICEKCPFVNLCGR
jgi:ATP-dependent helicase/nuclease subunit B